MTLFLLFSRHKCCVLRAAADGATSVLADAVARRRQQRQRTVLSIDLTSTNTRVLTDNQERTAVSSPAYMKSEQLNSSLPTVSTHRSSAEYYVTNFQNIPIFHTQ